MLCYILVPEGMDAKAFSECLGVALVANFKKLRAPLENMKKFAT
jgi:hypothetical protein